MTYYMSLDTSLFIFLDNSALVLYHFSIHFAVIPALPINLSSVWQRKNARFTVAFSSTKRAFTLSSTFHKLPAHITFVFPIANEKNFKVD